jgi:hypothetical protein
MFQRALCASLLGAACLVTACYDAPQPECAFLCGTADNACPDGYSCAADGWCKRNDVDSRFVCESPATASDAAVTADARPGAPDAAPRPDATPGLPDARPRPPDAAPPDARPRSPDAAPPDARPPDAAPPDARPPDAAPPDAPRDAT